MGNSNSNTINNYYEHSYKTHVDSSHIQKLYKWADTIHPSGVSKKKPYDNNHITKLKQWSKLTFINNIKYKHTLMIQLKLNDLRNEIDNMLRNTYDKDLITLQNNYRKFERMLVNLNDIYLCVGNLNNDNLNFMSMKFMDDYEDIEEYLKTSNLLDKVNRLNELHKMIKYYDNKLSLL
jgi:hypothetical protein